MYGIHCDFNFVAAEGKDPKGVLLLLSQVPECDTRATVSYHSKRMLMRIVTGLLRPRDAGERRMMHMPMQNNIDATLNHPPHDSFRIECHAVHATATRHIPIRYRE